MLYTVTIISIYKNTNDIIMNVHSRLHYLYIIFRRVYCKTFFKCKWVRAYTLLLVSYLGSPDASAAASHNSLASFMSSAALAVGTLLIALVPALPRWIQRITTQNNIIRRHKVHRRYEIPQRMPTTFPSVHILCLIMTRPFRLFLRLQLMICW